MADTITRELGYYPLAVDQFGWYSEALQISFQSLREAYDYNFTNIATKVPGHGIWRYGKTSLGDEYQKLLSSLALQDEQSGTLSVFYLTFLSCMESENFDADFLNCKLRLLTPKSVIHF